MDVIVIIRVNPPSSQSLVLPVESFESVPAENLIIAVEHEHDWVIAANVHDGVVCILEGSISGVVLYVGVFFFGDLEKVEISADDEVSAVGGGIVGDDGDVVAVILGEDWVEIVFHSKLGIIVVSTDD